MTVIQTTPPQPWLNEDGSRVRGRQLTANLPDPPHGEADADSYLAALLSLEESSIACRRAFVALAYHFDRAVNVGNPAPIVEDMGRRSRSPVVGDLVIERTAFRHADRWIGDWYRGFGLLVATRDEWCETDEEWARAVAEDPGLVGQRTATDAWYIQYGPAANDVCRWENCTFTAVPWNGSWT